MRLLPAVFALAVACSSGPGSGGDGDAGGVADAAGGEAGPATDAGVGMDSGAGDAGDAVDAAPGDDSGATDAGGADAGSTDGGSMDGGSTDAGPTDAGGPVASCGALTDAALLAAVYGGPIVPPGFYVETPGPMEILQWRMPCSASLADTRALATTLFGASALTGAEGTTTFFHEVDAIVSGSFTMHLRQTRCDYYDGTTLAGSPIVDPAPLKELADYLWFTRYHNLSGAHILAGIPTPGGATQRYEICHVQTVYGDFGLCDTITLYGRDHSVLPDGTVTTYPDLAVRAVTGMCH